LDWSLQILGYQCRVFGLEDAAESASPVTTGLYWRSKDFQPRLKQQENIGLWEVTNLPSSNRVLQGHLVLLTFQQRVDQPRELIGTGSDDTGPSIPAHRRR
jgi:hypothetical protein